MSRRSQTNKDLEENMTEKPVVHKKKKSKTKKPKVVKPKVVEPKVVEPKVVEPKISREELIKGLRKEIRTLRETDNVPFWKKPMTRDKENGLGASPIMFLAEYTGETVEPPTKGMERPFEKGFAPKYEELFEVFGGKKKVQGTPRLENVASALLDGVVYAHFMAGLGEKAAADAQKDEFAGGHGPFFLFMNEKKLRRAEKKKSERTKANFYSVDVIDFVVVPDVEQKAYLHKILTGGLDHKFITKSEMKAVEKKIYTYDEIIAEKTERGLKKKKKKKEEEEAKRKKKEKAQKKVKGKKVKETVNVPPGRAGVRLERPKLGEEGYDAYIKSQKKKKRRKKKTNVEEPPVNVSPVRPAAVARRRKRS